MTIAVCFIRRAQLPKAEGSPELAGPLETTLILATIRFERPTAGEATGFIPALGNKGKPITVIGTNSIRDGFDATSLQQTLNARPSHRFNRLAQRYFP